MKKNKKLLTLLGLSFFLASCNILPEPYESQDPNVQDPDDSEGEIELDGEEEIEDEEVTIIELEMDRNYYRPLLTEDGRYETSQNRGITNRLNSNINIKLFENDLMRLSQEYFSTENHFFQEGQYLPSNLVSSWLRRQGEGDSQHPDGLNPAPAGEDSDRVPIVLNSILEHDFYVQTDNGTELSGVSIGLALNQTDYYQAEQFDPTLSQEIPEEDMIEQGQAIAEEIVSRMREMEGLGNVPIMVGLFEQANRDNLAGGVYIYTGISEDGSSSIDEWISQNEERAIFPTDNRETPEGSAFLNFQSQIQQFFPNLSGVTGRAFYMDDALVNLEIDIMTQFYGKGEMVAFTQFLNEAATTYLPDVIEIEIKVESLNGIEAFLQRDAGAEEFNTHVFN